MSGMCKTVRAALLAVATINCASSCAYAQSLVIDGEEIADAKTLAAAKTEGKLVLYSSYVAETFNPLLEAFKADTGLRSLDYLRLTTQNLFPRVTAEYAAGKLAADIVLITDLPLVSELVQKQILAKRHMVPSFDRIPAELRDHDGRWYAVLRQVMAVGVNTALIKAAADQPSKWADLLDPRWKGKIGTPSIDAGGTAFLAYAFLQEKITPDYWKRLAAQAPRIYPGSAAVASDLVRGETSVAIIAASLLFPHIKSGAPIKMVFPEEGFPTYPVAGGITSVASHPSAAAIFLNWITSKRGGAVLAKTGAYASHPDAPTPTLGDIAFPPAGRAWNMSLADWERRREAYSAQWRATFGAK